MSDYTTDSISEISFTSTGFTDTGEDTTPPIRPTGSGYTVVNGDSVFLDWNNCTDASGIAKYVVEFTQITDFLFDVYSQESEFSHITLTDLAYGTWRWQVKAVDNAGNASSWSPLNEFDIEETAGNSFDEAKVIDVSADYNYQEYVGEEDVNDIYSFDVATAGLFDFSLTELTAKTFITLYSFDGEKYKKIKKVSAKTDKSTGDIIAALDDIMLDAGTYYLEVMSGDKGKGKCNTEYSLDITPNYFPDKTDDDFDFKTGIGTPDVLDAETGASGWVGFGDPQDVYQFDVAAAAEVDFALTGLSANAFLTIYKQVNGKYKIVKKTRSKTDGDTRSILANIDRIQLDEGTYYIEVMSADKGKGKYNTEYDLNTTTTSYPLATANNTWQDATAVPPELNHDDGFVGFGDPCDFYKFQVDALAEYDFALKGTGNNARLLLYYWDDNKNKLKKVANCTLKDGEANIDGLNLDAGLYYVEVLSADNGKGKKNTEYDLNITLA